MEAHQHQPKNLPQSKRNLPAKKQFPLIIYPIPRSALLIKTPLPSWRTPRETDEPKFGNPEVQVRLAAFSSSPHSQFHKNTS
ncbi:hypothetical protein CDAR_580461 [Caerostris darwini]|uniref:Uncharacterized protein n=1 Tax=Caerostris darwini TaxID=1538125 RepID=A0AAV4RAS2_9ARAC|nr:hypothetical protein CDAR_580461 [Caerostris darwini]